MPEVKAIVVSDTCPHCSDMKEYLRDKGLIEKVKFIRYETPEGKEFCRKNGIRAVPECVVLADEGGEKARVCTPKEFRSMMENGC